MISCALEKALDYTGDFKYFICMFLQSFQSFKSYIKISLPILELVVALCEQFHSSTHGNFIFLVLYFKETLFLMYILDTLIKN